MKLNYTVISSNPLRVKFFYEEKGRYGEFFFEQTRIDSRDEKNPTDKLGIRGEVEVFGKDKLYAKDLLQGLAETLNDVAEPKHLENYNQERYHNCLECGADLPDARREDRGNGQFEMVTECLECGATYTS